MDKSRIRTMGKRIRRSLFSHRSREFCVFLFFLFVSAGFWLLQTLDETYETDISVPLELTDVPDDVIITSPLPSHLSVTVRDKGAALMRYWRHKIPTVPISFSAYNAEKKYGRVRVPQADVLKAMQERLLSTSKIQSLRPDTLEFYYNHGVYSTMPVVIVGKVDADPHYYLLNVQTSPSEVKVFASASTLDTLTAVYTQPVSLTSLRENTDIDVPLSPIRGAKIEPASVRLSATVDVYMEQTIDVPIVSTNFPAGKQLRTFPSSVQVTYTVGYAQSKDINRKSFVSVVTYEELLQLQQQGVTKIPIRLKSAPENVSNIHIEPQEVDYLIEIVNEEE